MHSHSNNSATALTTSTIYDPIGREDHVCQPRFTGPRRQRPTIVRIVQTKKGGNLELGEHSCRFVEKNRIGATGVAPL